MGVTATTNRPDIASSNQRGVPYILHLVSHVTYQLPLFLAVLLITAASLKAYQISTEPIGSAMGIISSRWPSILLVGYEWALGCWLLSGMFARASWWVSLATFGAFTLWSLIHAIRGESCACFGAVEVSAWVTLGVDVGVLALLAAHPFATIRARSGRVRLVVISSLMALGILPTTWAMFNYEPSIVDSQGLIVGASRTVVLEPSQWVGRRFPLLRFVDQEELLEVGDWEVWLHRENCPKCVDKLRRHEGAASTPIVLLCLPTYDDEIHDELVVPRGIRRANLPARYEWFVETPVTVHLNNRMVVGVEEGT